MRTTLRLPCGCLMTKLAAIPTTGRLKTNPCARDNAPWENVFGNKKRSNKMSEPESSTTLARGELRLGLPE